MRPAVAPMTPTLALAGAPKSFERLASSLARAAGERDAESIQLAVEFARFVSRVAGPECPVDLLVATALVSMRVSSGNSCADLGDFLETTRPASEEDAERSSGADDTLRACLPADVSARTWRESLLEHPEIVSVPPAKGEKPRTPLVLDAANRLYLARYWAYEREVAEELVRRAQVGLAVDEPALVDAIEESFRPRPGEGSPAEVIPDLQRVAAVVAATRSLCILSGGPGTGKTSTVVRILATLNRLRLREGKDPLRIRLAAPTGKAAARMKEAIEKAREGIPEDLRGSVPGEAATIHRLLGFKSDSIYFRHDRGHQLQEDVLVVDEASMVDLPLMAKLLRALRPDARLVLVGDKDQLASVEAGSVLGDVCSEQATPSGAEGATGTASGFGREAWERYTRLSGQPGVPMPGTEGDNPLRDAIVILEHNYRFSRDSGIHRLAERVRLRDADGALAVLADGRSRETAPLDGAPGHTVLVEVESPTALEARLEATVPGAFRDYLALAAKGTEEGLFREFNRFRLLCAVRQGDFGVERVNELVADVLAEHSALTKRGEWYAGRPVMVTRNDYSLNLFNGDVGILLSKDGRDRVRFEDGARKGQSLPPARLPAHETVFAMTIHKSQGSEFDRVVVILPPKESRILGRELLYTAITRARESVEIWGTKDALRKAIETRLARSSGLADAIRAIAAEDTR